MCDPLTATSAVITAAGAASSYAGAQETYKASKEVGAARDQVVSAERQRQLALNAEGDAVNKTARDRYDNIDVQNDAKAKTLSDYFKGGGVPGGSAPTPAPSLVPVSNSGITVAEEGKKLGQAQDFSDKQGDALGKLRSFGDLFAGLNRSQARDAGTVAQLGGFKTGSAGVVPYELADANHAGDKTKFLGDLLSGAGKIGITAGLSGAGAGLSGLFAPAAPLSLAAPGVATTAGTVGQVLPAAATPAFNPFRIY